MQHERYLVCVSLLIAAWAAGAEELEGTAFTWTPSPDNPVLRPGPPGSWDENIRERMWVLYEDGRFYGWYGGWQGPYDKNRPNLVHMGYATSDDGVHWTKFADNPVFSTRWVEDLCVVKAGTAYFMYAEDETEDKTVIHLLVSQDKIHWEEKGNVLEKAAGSDWEGGWVGTPLVWKEAKGWRMLYEGGPPGDVALATSEDGVAWLRSDHNPVLPQGVGWESQATAADSVVEIRGVYHLFYHACGDSWQTGMALSRDLIHWTRYAANPVFPMASPVCVEAGDRYLMYLGTSDGVYLYMSPK